MNKKLPKVGIIILAVTLETSFLFPVHAAGNSNPTEYLPPTNQPPNSSNNSFDLGDWVNSTSGVLDQFEERISGTINTISNTIGGWVETVGGVLQPVNSIFTDVASLAQLVYRLIQLPSSIGGWWDLLITSVEGELDPCLNSPWISSTPPIVYEPGWCMGVGNNPNNPNSSSLPPFLPPSANPIPYAGKKPWDPNSWNQQEDNNTDEDSSPKSPTSSSDILKSSKGPMGIPVPSVARAKVIQLSKDDTKNSTDPFTSNPVVKAQLDGNLIDRAIIKTSTETVLGELGQKKMSEELYAAQDAVAYSLGQAGDAQNMDVTQDVMKQAIQVEALGNVLLGSLVSSNQQQRIDANMGNLALTNISRTLDEGKRSSNVDLAISSNRLISLAAQSGL